MTLKLISKFLTWNSFLFFTHCPRVLTGGRAHGLCFNQCISAPICDVLHLTQIYISWGGKEQRRGDFGQHVTQLWSVQVALVFLTTSSLLTQPVHYTGKLKHSDIQKTLSPQEAKCTFIKSTSISAKQRAFWAAPDAWTCLLSCKRGSSRVVVQAGCSFAGREPHKLHPKFPHH